MSGTHSQSAQGDCTRRFDKSYEISLVGLICLLIFSKEKELPFAARSTVIVIYGHEKDREGIGQLITQPPPDYILTGCLRPDFLLFFQSIKHF